MGRVNSSDAVVGVVRGAHAEAEGPGGPQRRRTPVVVVVSEAIHAFRFT